MLKLVPAALAGIACVAADSWLLVDAAEIKAASDKAGRQAWARKALDKLIADAEKAIAADVEIPDRGGQWPHWYSCKRDGSRLTTVSRAEHKCPTCGEVYRGEPYDSVVLYGVHRSNSLALQTLGLAYRFSGRGEFARRAGEILNAYADKYATYARHNTAGEDKVGGGRIMAQTLDESVWLIPVTWGYALVRETLGETARAHIERDLLIAAADVIREHRMGIHNIQCWKNSAVGLVGLVTNREDLVREAIDDPVRGHRVQMTKGVTNDGLWWEGSLGYHRYTMEAVWPLTEAARRAGIDLYDDRYRTLYEAPLALAFPNGDPPGFNDSAGSNVLTYAPLYEIAYARYKTAAFGNLVARSSRDSLQALLYGVEQPPDGPMIPSESVVLKSAGYAMLRAAGTAAAVRFGMHGGGHGHPDKLNLVTFARGGHFGIDPGSINYGVPLHREWYRSTIAHNTVTVDEAVQTNAEGALEKWSVADGKTTLIASAASVYPGVMLRRTVVMNARGEVEDSFECSAESEHTYDWAFHVPGKLTTSLTLAARPEPLPRGNGYQHIKDVKHAVTNDPWTARWQADGRGLTLSFKGAPGTEVITGVGPGRNPADAVPMIVVRRKAAKTVFDVRHSFVP
jgi:hypothetical protein